MMDEIIPIPSNTRLSRFDTIITDVFELSPKLLAPENTSNPVDHIIKPDPRNSYLVRVSPPPSDMYGYSMIFQNPLKELRSQFGGCRMEELVGKNVRVYYEGHEIIGIDDLDLDPVHHSESTS